MKKTFGIMLFLCLISVASQAQMAKDVIPSGGWLQQWEASYDVVDYKGDDLFFLINGGADLYMEYGFADVAAVELKHPQQGTLYVEVYRMDSDSAAFGIFSMRKGGLTLNVFPSPWVVFSEDVLHIWQGNYYISASGQGLQPKQRIHVFAALVNHFQEKIPADNILPLMLQNNEYPAGIECYYLMGQLALNNIYSFGPDNIFKIREAIVFDKDNTRKFVFSYLSPDTAQQVYQHLLEYMQTTTRFTDFKPIGEGFSVVDRNGNLINANQAKNLISLDLIKN